MSTSLERVRVAERPVRTPSSAPPPAPGSGGRSLHRRWDRWRRVHGRAPFHLVPTLLIAGVVQAWNLAGAPQRIDDEGTYVAQAWAITNLGELAHYTYWYDHPPLGWIQLAAYTELTGAFERWGTAVMAGREAVLVATVISTGLLWLLGRRTGLSRGAATAAALLFALSPLALQFHRTVYLDNIATPWLLGALILAMSRKHQLAEFVGAAVFFGIAVLTKETYLLALPLLAYVMYRSAWPATRRYTLSVAATVLVLVGSGYLLLAAINGELLPGEDRVSLADGVAFQLASRESSGTVGDPDSLVNRTLAMWWQLDPVFITAGLVAAVFAVLLRPLRPYALLVLGLVAFMFRPGSYLPVPYVIMLLPFAALLVAGTAGWAVRQLRSRSDGALLVSVTVLTAAVIAAAVAAPLWATQLRGFLLADLDRPGVQAQEWVEENVERTDRLIVDDSMWVDLVRSGFDRDNVIWYYKMDTDVDVMEASPNGWRDSDYIVTTDSMRTFPEQFPQVDQALSNSEVVASFGTGPQAVDVRRIHPGGLEERDQELAEQNARRAEIGDELTSNPALDLTPESQAQLGAGQVDARIVVALGLRASVDGAVSASFPVRDGEDGSLRRQVLITEVEDSDLGADTTRAAELRAWFENLQPSLAPTSVRTTDDGVLVTFPLEQPTTLLPR